MTAFSISEVARQTGLRPSAIRYYEQVGILPAAPRVAGQRRYDTSVVQRLAVLRRAQEVGFSLGEIRELFGGFRGAAWKTVAARKLRELDLEMERIQRMKQRLQNLHDRCACASVEQCGAAIISASRPAARSPRRGSPARG